MPKIEDEILHLHHRQQMLLGFTKMLDETEDPNAGAFLRSYRRMYVESQIMGIRRQADTDQRTVSLVRLLGQLEEHRLHFTRAWFVERAIEGMDDEDREFHGSNASATFENYADPERKVQLGRRTLSADRDQLRLVVTHLVDFANDNVAHSREPSTPRVPATWGDIDAAIDLLGRLHQKYRLLVTGDSLAFVAPTILGDWRSPFRRPLVDSEDRPVKVPPRCGVTLDQNLRGTRS